jgi:hypothetical protein
MKSFKFLQQNNGDIPTPQEIRHSPWLTIVYRQGWNAAMSGFDFNPPPEYRVARRTLNVWCAGYRDSNHLIHNT